MSSEASPAELYGRRIRRLVDQFDFEARILQFVLELYGSEAILGAWEEFRGREIEEDEQWRCEFAPNSPFAKLFISWLAHGWKPGQDPSEGVDADLVPTETFLQFHPGLNSLLYRYLEACTYAPFSFYEVLRCESGRAVNCRDIVLGREYEVFERTAAENLRQGDIVYARLVEIDGITLLEAVAPIAFPPAIKPTVAGLLDLIVDGAPVPTEIGSARQFLEDRERELRKIFWGLASLVSEPESLGQYLGSSIKLLH